jgi:hypothetical protein
LTQPWQSIAGQSISPCLQTSLYSIALTGIEPPVLI